MNFHKQFGILRINGRGINIFPSTSEYWNLHIFQTIILWLKFYCIKNYKKIQLLSVINWIICFHKQKEDKYCMLLKIPFNYRIEQKITRKLIKMVWLLNNSIAFYFCNNNTKTINLFVNRWEKKNYLIFIRFLVPIHSNNYKKKKLKKARHKI
jgi:hypothetical protein